MKKDMVKTQNLMKYLPILCVLGILAKIHGKNYCYPSQEKIIQLAKEKYDFEISRRHLNRVLNAFEEAGYYKRIRRLRRSPEGGMIKNTTLYVLSSKAMKLLGKMGIFLKRFILKTVEKVKEVKREIKQAATSSFKISEDLIKRAVEKVKAGWIPFDLPPDEYRAWLTWKYEQERKKKER